MKDKTTNIVLEEIYDKLVIECAKIEKHWWYFLSPKHDAFLKARKIVLDVMTKYE